jgi:transposase
MARDFRRPERRQAFLLPPDMQDWLPQDDIVPLVLDAVSLMDLAEDEQDLRVAGVGQAPFARSMRLALLIHAYSHGVTSSRAIERLCRRDAGDRSIVGAHVPDHTVPDHRVIARFRQHHGDRLQAVFVTPQQIILASGVTTEANDVQQLQPMPGQAQALVELLLGEDARLAAAAADAGYGSEENAASQTEECELFIATRQDRKQRAELREAASPRGRMPKGLSARQRLQRTPRTKRGRTIHAKRGASVEPVFDQMKGRQGAGPFSRRGLGACRGEWHLQAAVHELRKLHRASVRRRPAGGRMKSRRIGG